MIRLATVLLVLGLVRPLAAQDLSVAGVITEKDLEEARQPLPPTELVASADLRDVDVRGDDRTMYEEVAKAYGLLVMFDKDYQTSAPFRFRVEGAGYRVALRSLESATGSFVVPVSAKMFLVAKDTPQKRTELEQTMSIVIPLPETVQPQEAQEIGQAVRFTMDITRLIVDAGRRALLVRDRVSKVRPAQILLVDLLYHRPQVMIEMELLSTSHSLLNGYGLSWPSSFPFVNFGDFLHSVPAAAQGITNYLSFGGGRFFLGLGIATTQAFATYSRSEANTYFQGRLLALDGQAATLHVGDKYPIVTASFIGTTSLNQQGFSAPPTVTFEDLGVLLKVTPHVHGTEAVTLEVEAEFKVLGSGVFNGIPVISERKFQSKVRLNTGECAIVAGLVTNSKSKTTNAVSGLSRIPVFGSLFKHTSTDDEDSDILLVLKPHIVGLPPTEMVTHPLWVGSDTRPASTY